MLWILVVVLCGAFAFCMWGLTLSIKQQNKTKKLQNTADYNFKTKNGAYSFIYTIKGFITEQGKEIKIALQPVLGFSDLATSGTNQCVNIQCSFRDNNTGEEVDGEKKEIGFRNTLNVNDTLSIPQNMLNEVKIANIHVTIISTWNLGGKVFDEKLEFDFNK